MILYFVHTYNSIRDAVKQESSLLAERRAEYVTGGGMEGEMFNDLLVFDEEYEILFERLFREAQGEIISEISSNYLSEDPDLAVVVKDFPNFDEDKDFLLWLKMHDDFPPQYKKSIDASISRFLIDYICYRWLDTKSLRDAERYFLRLDPALQDIKTMLVRKSRPLRRLPSFP